MRIERQAHWALKALAEADFELRTCARNAQSSVATWETQQSLEAAQEREKWV